MMKYRIFLTKKLGTSFLTLPIGILHKSAIFNWYSDNISLSIYILSGTKGKSLCNSCKSLGYWRSTSRIHPFELLLVY